MPAGLRRRKPAGETGRFKIAVAAQSAYDTHMMTEAQGQSVPSAVPRHLAIIMDGNGRWATARHLPRQAGHRAGIDAVRRIVRAASDMGIGHLTLYSFSSENWRRPASEVSYLMDLLRFFFRREIADLHANNVVVRFLGERAGLAADICDLMTQAETKTRDNSGLGLNIAFNYGSQRELSLALGAVLDEITAGRLSPHQIEERHITANLFDPDLPDPDLVVRTGGDHRISNFLLWQAHKSQLLFVEKFWPDFTAQDLEEVVTWFAGRSANA